MELEKALTLVVAATPGFSVVEASVSSDDESSSVELFYIPVVAWLVNAERPKKGDDFVSWAEPVTPDITPGIYAVRCPDGSTIFPGAACYPPGDEEGVKRAFAERREQAYAAKPPPKAKAP